VGKPAPQRHPASLYLNQNRPPKRSGSLDFENGPYTNAKLSQPVSRLVADWQLYDFGFGRFGQAIQPNNGGAIQLLRRWLTNILAPRPHLDLRNLLANHLPLALSPTAN
jgi:hypothetical protein